MINHEENDAKKRNKNHIKIKIKKKLIKKEN